MADGYTSCACRDCFDIAIGKPGEALCHACKDAGCEPCPHGDKVNDRCGANCNCQRQDLYDEEGE